MSDCAPNHFKDTILRAEIRMSLREIESGMIATRLEELQRGGEEATRRRLDRFYVTAAAAAFLALVLSPWLPATVVLAYLGKLAWEPQTQGLYCLSRFNLERLQQALCWLPTLCLYFSTSLIVFGSNSLVPDTLVHSGYNAAVSPIFYWTMLIDQNALQTTDPNNEITRCHTGWGGGLPEGGYFYNGNCNRFLQVLDIISLVHGCCCAFLAALLVLLSHQIGGVVRAPHLDNDFAGKDDGEDEEKVMQQEEEEKKEAEEKKLKALLRRCNRYCSWLGCASLIRSSPRLQMLLLRLSAMVEWALKRSRTATAASSCHLVGLIAVIAIGFGLAVGATAIYPELLVAQDTERVRPGMTAFPSVESVFVLCPVIIFLPATCAILFAAYARRRADYAGGLLDVLHTVGKRNSKSSDKFCPKEGEKDLVLGKLQGGLLNFMRVDPTGSFGRKLAHEMSGLGIKDNDESMVKLIRQEWDDYLNKLKKEASRPGGPDAEKLRAKIEMLTENLDYVQHKKAGSSPKPGTECGSKSTLPRDHQASDDGDSSSSVRADRVSEDGSGFTLNQFANLPEATSNGLTLPHIFVLRLYTTGCFGELTQPFFNGLRMRKVWKEEFKERREEIDEPPRLEAECKRLSVCPLLHAPFCSCHDAIAMSSSSAFPWQILCPGRCTS